MAIKVKVDNASFNGYRAGVKFSQGVAIFEDENLGRAIAESLGYEVIEEKAPETVDSIEAPKKPTKKKSAPKKEAVDNG